MFKGNCNLVIIFTVVIFVSACNAVTSPPAESPYPQSAVIEKVNFDWVSRIQLAPGSDNWAITWADDNHQYASWGDGGGFGGTNSKSRVSLGVARIEGDAAAYRGFNVWGGEQPEQASQFGGKSYGIISIENMMYKWVSPGSNEEAYQESRLYFSSDHAASWAPADWAFDRSYDLVNPTFCQFGKAYQGARDDYVYIYANKVKDDSQLTVHKPGEIVLMRVPQSSLMEKDQYTFFSGFNAGGQPTWSKQFVQHQAVFLDSNGVGWNSSVSYNAGLNRYFLITEHSESLVANIGIFDAPQPWGPWTTVYYGKFGEDGGVQQTTFFYNFSNKWLSEDGKTFVLVYTGVEANDTWNTVAGHFTLRTSSNHR